MPMSSDYNDTVIKRREAHKKAIPKMNSQKKAIIFFGVAYFRYYGEAPTYRELFNFMVEQGYNKISRDYLVSSRLSELRKMEVVNSITKDGKDQTVNYFNKDALDLFKVDSFEIDEFVDSIRNLYEITNKKSSPITKMVPRCDVCNIFTLENPDKIGRPYHAYSTPAIVLELNRNKKKKDPEQTIGTYLQILLKKINSNPKLELIKHTMNEVQGPKFYYTIHFWDRSSNE